MICSSKATAKPVTGWEVRWVVMSHKPGICSEKFQFPIEGKVTSLMLGELREAILSVIDRADEIELDLLHVAEIDFAGLLLMVETKLTAISRGKTLRFIAYSKPVAEILGKSGLTDFFSIPQFSKENILQKLGQIPDYLGKQE
jgi:anti-anti-sigma regulatory factor